MKEKGNENKINNEMMRMKMNWHKENDEEEYKNEKKRIYSKNQEVGIINKKENCRKIANWNNKEDHAITRKDK